MIEARAASARLAARLEAKARAIAEARGGAGRDDPRRWRRAGWLWPLFGREK